MAMQAGPGPPPDSALIARPNPSRYRADSSKYATHPPALASMQIAQIRSNLIRAQFRFKLTEAVAVMASLRLY